MLQGLQPTTILIIVASILLALLVGAFLLSFLYFNKKALSYEGEIEQVKTAAETAVVKAHINGVEEERKRIGGDIHDDIGPMLAVARMSLYGFRHCHTPEEVRQHIDKDDLKKINGIGPFIEQKLNSLGIYTYEQVSRLDDELIDTLTTAIQFFPGRIKRDDWVGQATALLGSSAGDTKNTSVSKAGASPDDLKVVEGIGPKIEQLLKDNGIRTWEELSNTEVSRLREILEAAGSRYRMHSPTTWPDQAKLASLGQWEKLEEFQGYLTGGKDPSK